MKRRFFLVTVLLLLLAGLSFVFVRAQRASDERRRLAAEKSDASPKAASTKAREAAEKKAELVREWNASRKPVRAGTNAADVYKEAYELFDALTEDEKKMLKNPRDEVDADKAAELFKKVQPILELMRKAGGAEYCDWGVGPMRFDTPLPHLQQAMDLGRLGLWSAAYRFQTDPQGALDDLAARTKLGRTLPESLVGVLVAGSFDRGAVDLVAQNARALDPASTTKLNEMLRENFYADDFKKAMEGERSGVLAMADDISKKSMGETMKLFQMTNGPSDWGADAQGLAQLKAMGYEPAKLAQALREVAKMEEQFATMIAAPDPQFNAWWQQVQAGFSTNVLAKMTMPTIVPMRERARETQVQRAMLGAGVAIFQNGPGQLGAFTDPTTGGLFNYAPTPDGGFELRSTFLAKGKPVTMKFPPK